MPGRKRTSDKSKHDQSSKKAEVLIAGMGGEGVVLIGELLGLASTLEGNFATQRNSYGASQRGEAICSEIIISNESVRFPFIEKPTHFIALSKMGFDGYKSRLTSNNSKMIFVDNSNNYSLGALEKDLDADIFQIKALRLAINNKIPNYGNMIMLGAFVKSTELIQRSSIELALAKKMSKKHFDNNLKALKIGYDSI
jgi:2-oxoglutarate ferredoxin oxidoreductase subunit gamma